MSSETTSETTETAIERIWISAIRYKKKDVSSEGLILFVGVSLFLLMWLASRV
jgi:hypothetical protein